jgi:hypothetical protein
MSYRIPSLRALPAETSKRSNLSPRHCEPYPQRRTNDALSFLYVIASLTCLTDKRRNLFSVIASPTFLTGGRSNLFLIKNHRFYLLTLRLLSPPVSASKARNRLVSKLRREAICEGFLCLIRVKIAVRSTATSKIFSRIRRNKDPHCVRGVF